MNLLGAELIRGKKKRRGGGEKKKKRKRGGKGRVVLVFRPERKGGGRDWCCFRGGRWRQGRARRMRSWSEKGAGHCSASPEEQEKKSPRDAEKKGWPQGEV